MGTIVQLFKSLIEISLISSGMILIVLIIKAVFKNRINIKIISFLWLLVILRLSLPVMLESPVHIVSLFPKEEKTIEQLTPLTSETNRQVIDFSEALDYELPNNITSPAGINESSSNLSTISQTQEVSFKQKAFDFFKSLNLWMISSVIWVTGVIVALIVAIMRSLSFTLLINKRSKTVKDKSLLRIVNAYRRKNRIKRKIKILTCSAIHMPMIIGIIRPKILLPLDITNKMEQEHVSAILMHEVCHIKRNDILKNYVFILVKAVHWFNPLVWIGIKKIKENMEFSCDNRVLKLLGTKQCTQYGEALIQATRLINQRRTPQFATSLFENRSNLKERVFKMIKPPKKSKTAVVISMAIAFIMIIACFTTACQQTPEKLIVQQKDKNELMDAVQSTASTENGLLETNSETDILEHWNDIVESGKGTVKLMIDADVIIPANTQIPVVSLVPKGFSQKEVSNITKMLIGNNKLYQSMNISTKEEIMEQMIKTTAQMNDLDSDLAKSNEIETLEQLKVIGEQELERLKKLLVEAEQANSADVSEVGIETIIDSNSDEVIEGELIDLGVEINNQISGSLYLNNSKFGQTKIVYKNDINVMGDVKKFEPSFFSNSEDPLYEHTASSLNINDEDAQNIAKQVLNNLGIKNMKIGEVNLGYIVKVGNDGKAAMKKECYEISIYRCHNSIFAPQIIGRGSNVESEGNYSMPVEQEYMKVFVDDEGIICFVWSSPMETAEVLNQNVAIKDFSEIKEYFKQQFLNLYSYDSENFEYIEYHIDKIVLNLARIKIPDKSDEYMVVPVWDFFGTRATKYVEGEKLDAVRAVGDNYKIDSRYDNKRVSFNDDGQEKLHIYYLNTSYLTINASTGAIINRNLGY